MKILRRYLSLQVIFSTLMVLVVLSAMLMLVDFFRLLEEVSSGSLSYFSAGLIVILRSPTWIHDQIPMATLMGCMFVFSRLSQNAELLAMRASGMTPFQLMGALLYAVFWLLILLFLLGEVFIPYSNRFAQTLGLDLRVGNLRVQASNDIWMREFLNKKVRFISIEKIHSGRVLNGITIYEFDSKNMRLQQRMKAQSGVPMSQQKGWQLKNVEMTRFFLPEKMDFTPENASSPLTSKAYFPEYFLMSELDPDELEGFTLAPNQLSILALFHHVKYLESVQQNAARYRLEFWRHICMFPLMTLALALLATPFAYQPPRSSGMFYKNIFGVLSGLSVSVSTMILGGVAALEGLPLWVFLSLPSLMAIGGTLVLVYRIEKIPFRMGG